MSVLNHLAGFVRLCAVGCVICALTAAPIKAQGASERGLLAPRVPPASRLTLPKRVLPAATTVTTVTYTVTNTNDPSGCPDPAGTGTSLRCALTKANQAPNGDNIVIKFNINVSSTSNNCPNSICVIKPTSDLPFLTANNVTINGYTQPGSSTNTNTISGADNAKLTVQVDGTTDTTPAPGGVGLVLDGFQDKVQGIAFTDWINNSALYVPGGTNDYVVGDFFGVDPSGNAAPNAWALATNGATNLTVGGTAVASRNWFQNYVDDAMYLEHDTGDYIAGNLVVNVNSSYADTGIYVYGTQNLSVGGVKASSRNVIRGNGAGGVYAQNDAGTQIQSDWIGTGLTGTGTNGNAGFGVSLVSSSGDKLVNDYIAGTSLCSVGGCSGAGDAVDLNAVSNITVEYDYIGEDTAYKPAGNAGYGIYDAATPSTGLPMTSVIGDYILYNGHAAVEAVGTVFIRVWNNSTSFNGPGTDTTVQTGIDLAGKSPSACSTTPLTSGAPNDYLPCPVIASAVSNGTTVTVTGTAPAHSSIDLYDAVKGDQDGKNWLGTVSADSSGNWTWTSSGATYPYLTATSSAPTSNPAYAGASETSEFAALVAVT